MSVFLIHIISKMYEQLPNRDTLFLWRIEGNAWPDLFLSEYSLKTKHLYNCIQNKSDSDHNIYFYGL